MSSISGDLRQTVHPWPAPVEDVIAGDHVVALAYATPAHGAVILPLTNFGTHDRDAGTISVNSSIGVSRKLERIRRNPRVALAFHTRAHSRSREPLFVLAQGIAALSDPIPDYPSTILENWRRFEPWDRTPRFWKRWQRIYALRVEITVQIERILVWPDLSCSGDSEVAGWPTDPGTTPPQRPPRGGTSARVNAVRAARRNRRLPNQLLGWVGADGFPVVTACSIGRAGPEGMSLNVPASLLPPGGRRAGLTAHSFSEGVVGQHQRKHTGWLEVSGAGDVSYAPHTTSAYWLPPSRTVYRFVTGLMTRRGLRKMSR